MAQVDWYIEGIEFSNCNCDYACPCQFESPQPTYGDCRGFAAVRIDSGHFGHVTLDGLEGALLYAWPGPIYKGHGECQAVIAERANEEQRNALATILYGGETDEAATHWWVYRTMSSTVHPPLFKQFELDLDMERRTARIVISDVLESTARPIRSPATGDEHRVRIDLPNGIEFELAEVASGTTKTTDSVALDLKDTYCHFTRLRQSGKGVVHSR
ncbi:MAG TPA: DUF1326 domain-containing protein [Steroidobacter sp.]|uniref:DUF1326 domain-containing protein n=1 Tax=Steroidobacter sp. TaxID=1978227 RepID=UPI002ED9AFB6